MRVGEYRVFHETWQLVNSFEHLLPNSVLDVIKTFCSLFSFINNLLKYILFWNPFYYNMTTMKYFLLISLLSNNLTNCGRRHFKLFTNYNVSWDTSFFSFLCKVVFAFFDSFGNIECFSIETFVLLIKIFY